MEKVIKVNILDKYDLVEKYNEEYVSSDLINYIVNEAMLIPKKDGIRIEVNLATNLDKDYSKVILDGLKREYDKSLRIHHVIDIRQVGFFLLGVVFLFLSTLVENDTIFKEILVIGGWVPIWEMIELELFSDFEERRKRIVLKRLLNSKIVEK